MGVECSYEMAAVGVSLCASGSRGVLKLQSLICCIPTPWSVYLPTVMHCICCRVTSDTPYALSPNMSHSVFLPNLISAHLFLDV